MCNLSTLSQLFRIIIGLVLITLAQFGPRTSILTTEWINLWTLGWIGLIPLISGIAAFCPVYAVLGFGHQQKQKK
ncbi:MAG: DUF2892 domain-containing protein [Gammaproteobacteria bacterium]|nr:DUF2892 domain-containing protein [Gammaproteobacteria bacterium]